MTSPASTTAPLNVLIVGAKFGELYLNSFLLEQPSVRLAGLLANGSPRARALAHAFGIPLYTDIGQLPSDLDIACVVVRSAVVGGNGGDRVTQLLRRGLHVVQEHPVHPDEIARHQALAQAEGRLYLVNSFYPHTPAGRCWITAAQRVRRLCGDLPPSFAHLTTSRQLLYSSLDLLLQALGSDLAERIEVSVLHGDSHFHTLSLQLPDSHVLLRLQRWMSADDPDLHSLVMHQMTLGWASGYLSLDASHGPVNWTPALHADNHGDARQTLYSSPVGYQDRPTATPLLAAAQDWRSAHEVEGPSGVAWLLQGVRRQVHFDEALPPGLGGDYPLQLARLWQEVLRCAGPAEQRQVQAPRTLDVALLREED